MCPGTVSPDTWRARLADGSEWHELSAGLQGRGCSPFRTLEAMGEVVWVEAVLGLRKVALEAEGWPLVTGQAVDVCVPMIGSPARTLRYRWVCRQERRRWVWRVTDGVGAWEIETPPGTPGAEKMPRPGTEAN